MPSKRVRLGLERTLWPYQALAGIHQSKSLPEPEAADQQQLEQARAFYADLLIKGVVLEYDGGECWYDVAPDHARHPGVQGRAEAWLRALARPRGRRGRSVPEAASAS